MSKLSFSALSQADQDALLAQAAAVLQAQGGVKKDDAALRLEAYGTQVTEFVTSVITQETMKTSDKSDWAGYSVRGIPVVVDGHTFTVSVTVTDPIAKAKREEDRKIAEGEAAKAKREAALASLEA